MSENGKNRVEQWLEDHQDHELPVTGFEFEAGRTAIVVDGKSSEPGEHRGTIARFWGGQRQAQN